MPTCAAARPCSITAAARAYSRVAALKLGAARATGVDIDVAALLAARHNAMQNRGVAQFEMPGCAPLEVADIVLANILANPLKLLAPLLVHAARGAGRIVLSGILEHQADEVRDTYREGFGMNMTQHGEGWVLLSGVRRQESLRK